jgi:hypothetical protein
MSERARALAPSWPRNRWTPEQARVFGSRGGLRGDHPNKLANLRLGPAAAVAARVEYMRLKRERESAERRR